jgi:arylsulfatase A-like enzyme
MAAEFAIRRVICIAIDRLHAGYLGAYGNTWVETPAFNEFAAKSFLLDRAVTDSVKLDEIYRSFWLGIHAFCPASQESQRVPLATAFANAGFHTALISDEPQVVNHRLAASFAERIAVPPKDAAADQTVASVTEETEASAFFRTAVEWLAAAKSPYFLWLHTGTLGHRWDAPLEFREHYTAEDDPQPSDSAAVPNRFLPQEFDPDELTAATHAYAGQVTMLDELLGALLEVVDAEGKADETLIAIVAPRGIALGEHHRLGPCDEALYSDVTHIPWLIRSPSAMGLVGRSQAIVQPADFSSTIVDLCGLPASADKSLAGHGRSLVPLARGQLPPGFDRAFVAGSGNQAMVIPSWSLRISANPSSAESAPNSDAADSQNMRRELFVKPDDCLEVNEVADRCPEIVELLAAELAAFELQCLAGEPAVLADLPEALCGVFE